MKLKASKTFRHGSKVFARGTEAAFSEAAGRDLVAAGLAAEIKPKPEPKPEPKKAEAKKTDKAD